MGSSWFLRRRLAAASFVVLCVLAAGPVCPQSSTESLPARLEKIFNEKAWNNAFWGVIVTDLETSRVLYERNADKALMPASNMKIYTTAAALATLGPNFQFETHLARSGALAKNGTLRGDLVIIGSGDPSISGRYNDATPTTAVLSTWAKAVRDAGIRRIEGDVVGDDDVFDDEALCPSWQVDYLNEWYAAESSGLAINENCWDAYVVPGAKAGDKATIRPLFPTAYVSYVSEVTTTESVTTGSAEVDFDIRRTPGSNEVTLRGEIPLGAKPVKVWGSLSNGTKYTATLLREELLRQGVRVRGVARDGDELGAEKAARLDRSKLTVIHTHKSVPMSRIASIINKPSQNFYADMLLRSLGHRYRGLGSFAKGEQVVMDVLTSASISTTSLNMADGSGLSRQNFVTARMTASVLALMAEGPAFTAFYDSLPIAGVDGTIRRRMVGTAAANNARAKTGFIGRVRALSGYVRSKDNHRLVFSLIANNYTVDTSQANAAQDRVVTILANLDATQASLSRPLLTEVRTTPISEETGSTVIKSETPVPTAVVTTSEPRTATATLNKSNPMATQSLDAATTTAK